MQQRSPSLAVDPTHPMTPAEDPEHAWREKQRRLAEARARILAAGGIAEDDIRVTGWKEERALGEQLADRVIKATGSGPRLIEIIERALSEDFGSERGSP